MSLEPVLVAETVAAMSWPGGFTVSPLGLRRCGARPCLLAYPGTRLHRAALVAVEACLVATWDPRAFIGALRGSLGLEPGTAIRGPCPAAPGPRVEAVVAGRERLGDMLLLLLDPVHVDPGSVFPGYSRLLGATVEALVAYTRVAFYSRTGRCGDAARWLAWLASAASLAGHLEPVGEVSAELRGLLAEAEALMALNGCPPAATLAEALYPGAVAGAPAGGRSSPPRRPRSRG